MPERVLFKHKKTGAEYPGFRSQAKTLEKSDWEIVEETAAQPADPAPTPTDTEPATAEPVEPVEPAPAARTPRKA